MCRPGAEGVAPWSAPITVPRVTAAYPFTPQQASVALVRPRGFSLQWHAPLAQQPGVSLTAANDEGDQPKEKGKSQKVEESKQTKFGFNALTHEYEDLVKAGVIVPTKVERVALQNASSISPSSAALAGADMSFTGGRHGPNTFSTLGGAARKEAIKKGTAYMNVWMYAVREFEDAIDDCTSCTAECNEFSVNSGSVHAWDEGVAFYTGSLEGALLGGDSGGKGDGASGGGDAGGAVGKGDGASGGG